jgi:hypothetical protein
MSEGLRIDLDNMVTSTSDTSFPIELFRHGDFIGFHYPFPLVLFDGAAERSVIEATQETFGGDHIFSFSSLESESEIWWLINARPADTVPGASERTNQTSTILYSRTDGVLAIIQTPLDKNPLNLQPPPSAEIPHSLISCGDRPLTFEALSQAAAGPDEAETDP